MEFFLCRKSGTHSWFNWTWNQWLGGIFLVFLGCLNLIWPFPTLILIASLLVLVLFLISPYIALVIATLLIIVESFSLAYLSAEYGVGYGLSHYAALIGVLCWGVARLAGVTPPYQSTTLDLPLAVLYVTCVIGLLWTPYLQDGFNIVFSFTMSASFYVLISALNSTPKHLENLFWLWFVLGIITVITVFASFFFGFYKLYRLSDYFFFVVNFTQFKGNRESLRAAVGGPKAIACILNMAIFCGLSLLCTRVRRSSEVLIYLGLLVILFFHILTLSRYETMGLLLGWFTFASLNPQWRNQRMRKHVLMVASYVIVFLALLFMLNSFYSSKELFARLIGQEQTAGTTYRFSGTQSRWDHIVYALYGIWETGGLGGGTGGIMRGMDPSAWIDSPSFYFSFLTDHGYGILSLLLMGWIMINLIIELRWALRNCPDPRFKIFIIGVCSALMMFGTPFGDQFFYIYEMWVLLGFAVVAVKGVRFLLESSPPPG